MSGHETRLAHDGLDAVQAAAAFRPDLVLLDIGLPKLNGYEAVTAAGTALMPAGLAGWPVDLACQDLALTLYVLRSTLAR